MDISISGPGEIFLLVRKEKSEKRDSALAAKREIYEKTKSEWAAKAQAGKRRAPKEAEIANQAAGSDAQGGGQSSGGQSSGSSDPSFHAACQQIQKDRNQGQSSSGH